MRKAPRLDRRRRRNPQKSLSAGNPKKLQALVAIRWRIMFSSKSSATCDAEKLAQQPYRGIGPRTKAPAWATNGVLHAEPDGRRVVDLSPARSITHLRFAGRLLSINAERHLKSARQWSTSSPTCPKPSKTRRLWPNASNSHSKISVTNFRNTRCLPVKRWIRSCAQASPERARDIPTSAQKCSGNSTSNST